MKDPARQARPFGRALTKVRNRLAGLFYSAYYRLLKPLYFSRLGAGLYCHGFIRFKHLCPDLSLGAGVYFGPRVTIDVPPEGRLSIGAGTAFTGDTCISAAMSVEIGRDCLFSEFVSVRDANHGTAAGIPIHSQPMEAAPVKIGDGVWVGRGAAILRGVTIGDGAVIGANAVVTHDIPANAIAVGSPARVIRMRS